MPVVVTVRNVPERVRDELAARAARSGRSLQEYLLAELARIAERPAADDVIARARARAEALPPQVTAEDILRDRDADRR
jgi:plasmid stability protein